MYPKRKRLEELSPEKLAVIKYLYDLSSPPAGPRPPLAEQAVRGLSHFLKYAAKAAHEPGMLSILGEGTLKGKLRTYGSEGALVQHMFEVIMQQIIVDEEHTPETHPYVTPLVWPPAAEGKSPRYMDRSTLHMHLLSFVFGSVEGVHGEVMIVTRNLVRNELMSAIRKHYARRRKPRGQKT